MATISSHPQLSNPRRAPAISLDVVNRAQALRLGGSQNLAPYRSDFHRALGEYNLGRFEEAESILNLLASSLEPVAAAQKRKSDAIEVHLLYASTLSWLGRTADQLNHEKEMISAFRRAKAEFQEWISQPKEPSGYAYLDYGVTLFKLERTSRALKAFTEAANTGTHTIEGNFYTGMCLERLDRLEEAEKYFRAALKQDPNHYAAHKALAELLEKEKRIPEAVDEYHTAVLQMLDNGLHEEALTSTERILKLTRQDPKFLALKGDILRLQGNLKSALETINRSLKRQPENAFASAIKGQVLLDMGQKNEGVRLLEQALRLDPKIDWVPVELAVALCESGEYEKALSVLKKALTRNPRNLDALVQKAETLKELDRNEEALPAVEQALKLKPNDALLLGKKGQILRHLNRFKQAYKVLQRAIKLESHVGWIHGELGAVLYSMGQPDDALEAVNNALAIQPDDVFALSYKSEILRTLGIREEALKVINQALALSPDNAWALGTKGQVLRDMGRTREAIKTLQRSIELNPGLGWVHLEFSVVQYSIGNYKLALEALDEALKLEDDDEWHLFKAQILCEIGNFKEAVVTLDAALRLNNKRSAAFGLKGWALQHLGVENAANALRAYKSAVKLKPDNLWWHRGIANALYLMGDIQQAFDKYQWVLTQAEQSSKEESDDVSLISLKGWCHYRLGHCKEAVELFKKIVSINPTEIATHFDLALAFICSKRYPEALTEYRRGVQHSMEQPAPRRGALVFIALDDLKVAIRMEPELELESEIKESLDLLNANLNDSQAA